jgi:hypothetical protein
MSGCLYTSVKITRLAKNRLANAKPIIILRVFAFIGTIVFLAEVMGLEFPPLEPTNGQQIFKYCYYYQLIYTYCQTLPILRIILVFVSIMLYQLKRGGNRTDYWAKSNHV